MRLFIFGFISVLVINSFGNEYYVSPSGSDQNIGTKDAPWQTIQKGASTLMPGDTLFIGGGVYRITKEIRPANSGTTDAWITYKVLPGEKAVVDAEGFVNSGDSLRPYPSRLGLGSFHLEKVSYTRVEGLIVRNSRSAGFIVRGPSQHVELINCKSDRSYNSGIGIWYSDHVKVLNCEVTRANEQEIRVPGQPTGHEAPHEAISICGAKHFEVAYNHVHQCFKEGIDVKEVSAHGVVHHNHVHDLPRQGLYVDAWFGLLHDVTFHSNVVHDCEWGFALSVEGRDSELRNIRFHNNLLFDNRASGILFGVWGNNRMRYDIEIFNNTIYNNGSPGHWAGTTGGIDIRSENMENVKITRNIIYNNWGFEIATTFPTNDVKQALKERNVMISDNLTGKFRSEISDFSFFETTMIGFDSDENFIANPLFTDPDRSDLSIPFYSPASGNYPEKGNDAEGYFYGALKPGERVWLRKY